jgi:hypothetical protein
MLEVEDWTQPGTSKRRQSSKKATAVVEPKEDPPVPLSAPPDNEVEEETFHPARAPNSRHFPAARFGIELDDASCRPIFSLTTLGPGTSGARATTTRPNPPSAVPSTSPTRTPSPQPPAATPFPTAPLPATTAPGRPHSSPLRPGSRASRLSTSSRYSTPRLPAFGGAGGSPAKAVRRLQLPPRLPSRIQVRARSGLLRRPRRLLRLLRCPRYGVCWARGWRVCWRDAGRRRFICPPPARRSLPLYRDKRLAQRPRLQTSPAGARRSRAAARRSPRLLKRPLRHKHPPHRMLCLDRGAPTRNRSFSGFEKSGLI